MEAKRNTSRRGQARRLGNGVKRVTVLTTLDPALLKIINRLAVEDDRSLSNMVDVLLQQSPQVLEAQKASRCSDSALSLINWQKPGHINL